MAGTAAGISRSPADAVANPQALAAVERADLIVLGPGSLFTSTLPPLLVPGLGRAVLHARGLRVYVCNLLQQPGETIGYLTQATTEPESMSCSRLVGANIDRHHGRTKCGAGVDNDLVEVCQ